LLRMIIPLQLKFTHEFRGGTFLAEYDL